MFYFNFKSTSTNCSNLATKLIISKIASDLEVQKLPWKKLHRGGGRIKVPGLKSRKSFNDLLSELLRQFFL